MRIIEHHDDRIPSDNRAKSGLSLLKSSIHWEQDSLALSPQGHSMAVDSLLATSSTCMNVIEGYSPLTLAVGSLSCD